MNFGSIAFHKYSANGNDFVIFHTFTKGDYSQLARRLCHRFNGIGADGLVVVLPYSGADSSVAYEWDFYNADGSRANLCGNASRCVGHYAYVNGLAPATHCFITQLQQTRIHISVDSTTISSNLGVYKNLHALPYETHIKPYCQSYFDEVLLECFAGVEWLYIDTGVPHLVCFVRDSKLVEALTHTEQDSNKQEHSLLESTKPESKERDSSDVDSSLSRSSELSEQLLSFMRSLRYAYNANVNLAYAYKSDELRLATYERGVENITLACGTGMAAVFLVGHIVYGYTARATLIPPSNERLQLWCEKVVRESLCESQSPESKELDSSALDSNVLESNTRENLSTARQVESSTPQSTQTTAERYAIADTSLPILNPAKAQTLALDSSAWGDVMVFLQGRVQPIAICHTLDALT